VHKLLALDVEVERDLLGLGEVGLVRVGEGPAGLDVADLLVGLVGWWVGRERGRRKRKEKKSEF